MKKTTILAALLLAAACNQAPAAKSPEQVAKEFDIRVERAAVKNPACMMRWTERLAQVAEDDSLPKAEKVKRMNNLLSACEQ